MRSVRVSAIIPVHNGEHFVGDAIDSVIRQTHSPLECLVVDDGSTDATPDVVRRFGDRVRYLRREQGGVSSARNAGVAAATGEMVAFLDADDIWLPLKIEHQLEALASHPDAAMAYCGLHIVGPDLEFRGRMEPAPAEVALRNTLTIEKPFMTGIGSTALLHRDTFDAIGGFDERISTSADYDFACRIAARYSVTPVQKPLVLYRAHTDQMHKRPEVLLHDVNLVFEKLFSNGAVPPDLQRLERRARANLHVSVAGRYLKEGDRRRFTKHLARALLLRPDRVWDGVRRLSRPPGAVAR